MVRAVTSTVTLVRARDGCARALLHRLLHVCIRLLILMLMLMLVLVLMFLLLALALALTHFTMSHLGCYA